jgi:3-phenylpropionate/cinnamic acid dioxygenase small subunit
MQTHAGVVDEWAICRTLYRFAAGIDTRDWELYRSVFTDDIELDYSSYRPGSVGHMRADDWVARGSVLFTGLDATQHCLYNPLVSVAGDVADLTMYVQAEHFLTNADGDNWFTLGGYYRDRLVREESGWKIAEKKLVVTWNRGNRNILAQAAERGRQRSAEQ